MNDLIQLGWYFIILGNIVSLKPIGLFSSLIIILYFLIAMVLLYMGVKDEMHKTEINEMMMRCKYNETKNRPRS